MQPAKLWPCPFLPRCLSRPPMFLRAGEQEHVPAQTQNSLLQKAASTLPMRRQSVSANALYLFQPGRILQAHSAIQKTAHTESAPALILHSPVKHIPAPNVVPTRQRHFDRRTKVRGSVPANDSALQFLKARFSVMLLPQPLHETAPAPNARRSPLAQNHSD